MFSRVLNFKLSYLFIVDFINLIIYIILYTFFHSLLNITKKNFKINIIKNFMIITLVRFLLLESFIKLILSIITNPHTSKI